MDILELDIIRDNLHIDEVVAACERNFDEYSLGNAVIPPVGHLPFPDGDCHIKYGYIKGDPHFVVKIATGFHQNIAKGLKTSAGLMLIGSTETGFPLALLDDQGHLTDVRTAIAGSIAAKYLAPTVVRRIGIVGAGVQADLQLTCLRSATKCRNVTIWNRSPANATALAESLADSDFDIECTENLQDLVRDCDLLVTTTPTTSPLIQSEWVQPGTHITAVGADCPGKQELDETLVARADICVVDSLAQCKSQGEIQTALANGRIDIKNVIELGDMIGGRKPGRTADEQITIADLTGVAVQDIAIAKSVYATWLRGRQ